MVIVAAARGRGMSEVKPSWRLMLFRTAIAFVAIDVVTYLCGIVVITLVDSVDGKIRAGAWFFLIGSVFSLIALTLSFFGYGRRRVGVAFVCLLALPLWYGFTLY